VARADRGWGSNPLTNMRKKVSGFVWHSSRRPKVRRSGRRSSSALEIHRRIVGINAVSNMNSDPRWAQPFGLRM
jgi:hypothetical protein